MSILARLVARERATGAAPSGDKIVLIWREVLDEDPDAKVASEIKALTAAGRIGPSTEIRVVGWQPCLDSDGNRICLDSDGNCIVHPQLCVVEATA